MVSVTSLDWVSKADGSVLVRLEHLCTPGLVCDGFDQDEDFDFNAFFIDRRVRKVTEYNLIGNFPLDERERLVWKTQNGTENTQPTQISKNFIVTLKATDLKTFLVKLD